MYHKYGTRTSAKTQKYLKDDFKRYMVVHLAGKKLEVLSITPTVETQTGDTISVISFGEYIPVDEDLKKSLKLPDGVRMPKKIGVNWLILYLKTDKMPYAIGSNWELTIKPDGNLELKGDGNGTTSK